MIIWEETNRNLTLWLQRKGVDEKIINTLLKYLPALIEEQPDYPIMERILRGDFG